MAMAKTFVYLAAILVSGHCVRVIYRESTANQRGSWSPTHVNVSFLYSATLISNQEYYVLTDPSIPRATLKGFIHLRPDHHKNASVTVPDKFIAGGHPAKIGQFPWIARLSIKDKVKEATYLCAGSLISSRYVLTAAHCVEEVDDCQDIEIYLGDYDRRTFPVDCVKNKCTKNWMVHPNKIKIHPEYNSDTISNDIALLRLKKAAPLAASVNTISLPPFNINKASNKGMPLAITGWGKTEDDVTSDVLLTTEISLIPKKNCPSDVPPNHICAGDAKGKDTCPGDSGGPLFMFDHDKYYLVGIVSYGPSGKCGSAKMGYYTNVYMYKKWIKLSMRK